MRCSSAPSGGSSPCTTVRQATASAGKTTLWRTRSMNSVESSGAQPGADFRRRHTFQGFLLPVHQLRHLEARRRAAQMLRPEMRGHLGGGQPAIDVAGMAQAETND